MKIASEPLLIQHSTDGAKEDIIHNNNEPDDVFTARQLVQYGLLISLTCSSGTCEQARPSYCQC